MGSLTFLPGLGRSLKLSKGPATEDRWKGSHSVGCARHSKGVEGSVLRLGGWDWPGSLATLSGVTVSTASLIASISGVLTIGAGTRYRAKQEDTVSHPACTLLWWKTTALPAPAQLAPSCFSWTNWVMKSVGFKSPVFYLMIIYNLQVNKREEGEMFCLIENWTPHWWILLII